jgi:hypothetical protein
MGSQGQASPLLLVQVRFSQDATTKYRGRVVLDGRHSRWRGRMDGWTIGAAHLKGSSLTHFSLLVYLLLRSLLSHRSGTTRPVQRTTKSFCRVSLGGQVCVDGVVCLSLHRCWISMARCREATGSSYPCRRRRHEDARARDVGRGRGSIVFESSSVGRGA